MSSSALPALPTVAGTNPELAALDGFKIAVAAQVAKILELPLEQVYEGVESGKTGKGVAGDFCVAVPRFRLKSKPNDISQKIQDNFVADGYIESCTANGAFVWFNANTSAFTKAVMHQVNEMTYLAPPSALLERLQFAGREERPAAIVPFQTGGYGTNITGAGKRVLIDFSSPNIAKPFHAGHLRSTIIGAFIANLYEANGWEAIRMNYLGDWGKQFGILAVGFEKYGSEEKLKEDPITHLYEVYVKINADGETDTTIHDRARAFFVKMEAQDPDAVALWKKFRDLSIAKYKDAYARLNIYFDIYWGESQVSNQEQVDAVAKMRELGLVEESKGAVITDLTKYKLEKTVVQKQDGTFVYITRDIAGAKERMDTYNMDKSIYVVASQQDLHNAQLFKVLDLMGYEWANKLQHINFGMVLGMSTRKGTAVFLEQILNESKDVMHEVMKKNEAKYNAVEDPESTSDKLGISAVKIQDMAGKRINNYKFEWSRMTSFEGDTGPYLQYAHVRLCSIVRKNAHVILPPPERRAQEINTDLLTEPAARAIVYLISTYPDVIKAAFKSVEPATVVTFCFRLAHAVSQAWETLNVKGAEPDVALARLWLYVTAKDVLASGMKLLTLDPLTHM